MYQPSSFLESDPSEIIELIRIAPLAQVVIHGDDGFHATPVPLLFDAEQHRLIGHLARPNDVGKMGASLGVPLDCLVMFPGADGYISPSAYPSKTEHGKVVPTWNYETVHVHGRFVVHDDADWVLDIVSKLTNHFEADRAVPWSVLDAPHDYIATMLKGIVGIEILIDRIEAKRKLSQNRPDGDQAGVRADLADRGTLGQALLARMPTGEA
jgi:transcriptional regulator